MAYIPFPLISQYIQLEPKEMVSSPMKYSPSHVEVKQYLYEKMTHWYEMLKNAEHETDRETARFVLRAYVDMQRELYGR